MNTQEKNLLRKRTGIPCKMKWLFALWPYLFTSFFLCSKCGNLYFLKSISQAAASHDSTIFYTLRFPEKWPNILHLDSMSDRPFSWILHLSSLLGIWIREWNGWSEGGIHARNTNGGISPALCPYFFLLAGLAHTVLTGKSASLKKPKSHFACKRVSAAGMKNHALCFNPCLFFFSSSKVVFPCE